MPHFTKPEAGSWTEHFGLATDPVSYDDSISPQFYELEREAIFKNTWLNVGRVEQLPKRGSFFTKELDAAKTSVIIVRNAEGALKGCSMTFAGGIFEALAETTLEFIARDPGRREHYKQSGFAFFWNGISK